MSECEDAAGALSLRRLYEEGALPRVVHMLLE